MVLYGLGRLNTGFSKFELNKFDMPISKRIITATVRVFMSFFKTRKNQNSPIGTKKYLILEIIGINELPRSRAARYQNEFLPY